MRRLGEIADEMRPDIFRACRRCRERYSHLDAKDPICDACRLQERVELENALPKPECLVRAGVPCRYRDHGVEKWLRRPWPTAWPDDSDVTTWRGSPWSVTFQGVNGSGKSQRAAHLLWLFWRDGFRPRERGGRMWRSESELVAEQQFAGYGEPRYVLDDAVRQVVLVVDDLGATRDRQAGSWDLMLRLAEARYHSEMPTIWTTHRPLSERRAEKLGVAGQSIETLCPALFDRLRDGLIMPWASVSHRGPKPKEEIP